MSGVAQIDTSFTDVSDLPRVLRNAAVALPPGHACAIRGLTAKDMLVLARRVENTAPIVLVCQVPTPPLSGPKAVWDAVVISMSLYGWIYWLIPAVARVIRGWL